MQENSNTFLDPSKELPAEDGLVLDGIAVDFERENSHIRLPEPDVQPVQINPFRKPGSKSEKDLRAYRKKRNKRNKSAKQSRKTNRKHK